MSSKLNTAIAVAGIDIGKSSFHVIGLDKRGAIVLRQKWSRGQVEGRLTQICLAEVRFDLVKVAATSNSSASRPTLRMPSPNTNLWLLGKRSIVGMSHRRN